MTRRSVREETAGSEPWVERLRPTAAAALLVILTFVAFRPALDNGFLNWDDDENFLTNPHFRGLGRAQVAWAWSTFHFGAYQPLAWMLLSAESQAWGLDPKGYHAVSVLVHAVNVAALYALTLALLRRAGFERGKGWDGWAAVAVAFWAVHPLRVEPVAWASGQPYLPCALFSVLAVLAYLRACGQGPGLRPHAGWLTAAWLLVLAALLCKAPAATLPAVLIVLDVDPLNRLGGGLRGWFGPAAVRVWREKVPFLGLSLVFLALAYYAKASTQGLPLDQGPDLLTRVGMFGYGVWFYLFKTAVPRNLSAYYALPGPWDWTQPRLLGSVLGVVGVSAGFVAVRRRWPGLLAAWAAFLVLLVPSPALVAKSPYFAADRYTYLAAMPFVPLLAAGLVRVATRLPRRAVIALGMAGLATVAGLTALTRGQVRTWRDPEALWTHAIAHGAGHCMRPYANLGMFYGTHGRADQAIATYRAALRVPPDPTDLEVRSFIHMKLAALLFPRGEAAEADTQMAECEYLYGRLLAARGRGREAVPYFATALQLKPDHERARAALKDLTRGALARGGARRRAPHAPAPAPPR